MATQMEVFRLVAPEFAAETDETVQSFLDLAPLFIDPMKFPESSRGLALVLQAASLMWDRQEGISGNSSGMHIKSEREGDLSRTYGNSTSSNVRIGPTNRFTGLLDSLMLGVSGASILTRFGGCPPSGGDIAPYADNIGGQPRNLYGY